LAWHESFEKPLDDGSRLILHGLNSALISDENDTEGKLLVTEFQTSHMRNEPGVVNLVMCHHPPCWLMDRSSMQTTVASFAQVALYGHEHTTRIVAESHHLQLFAGAVQPSRRDPDWLPTYHILQLAVEGSGEGRNLFIRVWTRVFIKAERVRFRPRLNEKDETVNEYRIPLPEWTRQTEALIIPDETPKAGPSASDVTTDQKENVEIDPRRELIVYFFRLDSPGRYEVAHEADLLRDGDDQIHPQAMWAEVFKRAVDEAKLNVFWSAVSARVPELREKTNPFSE
jgi:hypothetical protein